jgi:hypothetical protein
MANKIKKIIGNYSYDPSDKIGSGFSSNVYKGINEKTGEMAAIKVFTFFIFLFKGDRPPLNNDSDKPNTLKK